MTVFMCLTMRFWFHKMLKPQKNAKTAKKKNAENAKSGKTAKKC